MIAFSVTCKHLHRHCIRLSSFSYTSVFTAFTFHSSTIFITFTHLESQFYSLTSSVAFNVIVTSAHLHLHSTHRHYHFHWSSFLPHFYCHLHSHWTCPCGACTGIVKARTGTGLLILCLYRPCMGMVMVSMPSRVCLFCFVSLMKDLRGSHSYSHDVTLNILSSVYIFQTHRYQTASEFREHIALFQWGHNFSMK